MDVDTDISAHLQSLKRQKEMLKMAQSRQGQSISNLMPREQTYQQFMMSHMAMEAEKNRKDDHMFHSSFIPPAYLPCTTPLAQLKPVTIRQLRAETHHRGTFLLLRAIAPPNRMTAILVLAEDERGDVVLLQMYQQEEEETREATELANVGTVLLIKEPYYKFMASGDYGLRVDHLSDVIQVHKDDPMIPYKWLPRISEVDTSSETYKSRGDTAIGAGKYWQAIKEYGFISNFYSVRLTFRVRYSDALRQNTTPDRVEVIKRNRSLAYLRTKQYDAALLDTGFPDFGPKPPEKALFRAAQALYSLRRFRESIAVLEKLHANFPNNREALAALERARNRHAEQTTGVYDFNLLQREAKKLKPPQLDHATYAAPVEIKSSASKGRGLFVTRAVKAGELLLCEKAFSCAHVSETDKRMTFLMNVDTEKGFLGGQADLIRITAQRLYCNPSLAPEFTSLHHGTYKSAKTPTVDGTPVVDT
jgi:tetratricopeptide (TPR) repeat protein